jgi:hypothetical protein
VAAPFRSGGASEASQTEVAPSGSTCRPRSGQGQLVLGAASFLDQHQPPTGRGLELLVRVQGFDPVDGAVRSQVDVQLVPWCLWYQVTWALT